jgi:hypothetical protein
MSQGEDPEQLIAQALRAHVARTPMPAPTDDRTTAHQPGQQLGGFRGPATATDESVLTSRLAAEPRVPAALVLLLAVLLGLAAGAVVGLLTLI